MMYLNNNVVFVIYYYIIFLSLRNNDLQLS